MKKKKVLGSLIFGSLKPANTLGSLQVCQIIHCMEPNM